MSVSVWLILFYIYLALIIVVALIIVAGHFDTGQRGETLSVVVTPYFVDDAWSAGVGADE